MFGLAEKAGPIAATAVTTLLTAGGVAAGPAGLIAGLLALVYEAYAFWILSQDDGNGVALWISWNGTLFWVENP